MGSKARIAKDILPIILKDHKPEMWYVEPFVGGCNMIDKVDVNIAPKRVGFDTHEYLIALWQAASIGWTPPEVVTEDQYTDIKNNKHNYPKELVGYVGFALSFGGKWFGGWSRNKRGYDYAGYAYRNAMKQYPKLKGVKFNEKSVFDIVLPKPSTIYCDPPYKGTTKYKDSFDHERFYGWCREKKDEGHNIFISEYNMPEGFVCVWEKEIISNIRKDNKEKPVERLYTVGETNAL